jgi:hypothetical protein
LENIQLGHIILRALPIVDYARDALKTWGLQNLASIFRPESLLQHRPKNSLVKVTSLPGFFVGHPVADMVDAFEGRYDLFVMGDDDDCRAEFSGHGV